LLRQPMSSRYWSIAALELGFDVGRSVDGPETVAMLQPRLGYYLLYDFRHVSGAHENIFMEAIIRNPPRNVNSDSALCSRLKMTFFIPLRRFSSMGRRLGMM
jgi:hypothetical protein